MTPREELLGDIDNLVEAYGQSRQETRMTLNKYAIGKWVPVSERLPEFDDGQFMGWIRFNDGTLEHDLHSDCMIKEYASHWLELDIPEVEP